MKYLSKKHELWLLSFIESSEEMQYVQALKPYCREITTVLNNPQYGFVHRLSNLFENRPYFMAKHFASDEMRHKLATLLNGRQFDLIHTSTLAMAQYTCDIQGVVKILDGVDSVSRNNLQQWKTPTGLRNRILSFIDWLKTVDYEPSLYSRFDRCLLVSAVDRDFLHQKNPRLPIDIATIGVDHNFYHPDDKEESAHCLVFSGVMNYIPNDDAMIFFCSSILPIIEKKYPAIPLYIVGKNVSRRLAMLARKKPNIILMGFVEDNREIIGKSTIFVCPLRIGTGVKNKVLEAMAMGKAIVSTSVGAEGIPVVNGRDMFIADKPDEFAEAVIRLLEDENTRREFGVKVRQIVLREYDMEKIALTIDAIYIEEFGKNNPIYR